MIEDGMVKFGGGEMFKMGLETEYEKDMAVLLFNAAIAQLPKWTHRRPHGFKTGFYYGRDTMEIPMPLLLHGVLTTFTLSLIRDDGGTMWLLLECANGKKAVFDPTTKSWAWNLAKLWSESPLLKRLAAK